MSILKKAAELFSPSDPELVDKTLARLAQQDTWNDVFSTKLFDVLDNIDGLKTEVRQSSRTIEQRAAKSEKSLDESIASLKHAQDVEEKSTALLREAHRHLVSSKTELEAAYDRAKSAEDALTRALELASDACARDARALSLLRKATLWAVAAIGLSWTGVVWIAWVVLRTSMPIWTAFAATVLILLAGFLVLTRRPYEI